MTADESGIATPRDIVRSAIDHNVVDGREVSESDLADASAGVLGALDRAGYSVVSHVYVLEVTFFGEYGWTSVHSTPEGARARLEQKVDEYDAREAFEAAEIGDERSSAAGDEGEAVVWGISYLPVER